MDAVVEAGVHGAEHGFRKRIGGEAFQTVQRGGVGPSGGESEEGPGGHESLVGGLARRKLMEQGGAFFPQAGLVRADQRQREAQAAGAGEDGLAFAAGFPKPFLRLLQRGDGVAALQKGDDALKHRAPEFAFVLQQGHELGAGLGVAPGQGVEQDQRGAGGQAHERGTEFRQQFHAVVEIRRDPSGIRERGGVVGDDVQRDARRQGGQPARVGGGVGELAVKGVVAAFLQRQRFGPGLAVGVEIALVHGDPQAQGGGVDARAPVQHPADRRGHAFEALKAEVVFQRGDDALLVVREADPAQGGECGPDVSGVPDLSARRRHPRLPQAFRQERTRKPARDRLELQQQPVGVRQLHVPLPQGFEWGHGNSLAEWKGRGRLGEGRPLLQKEPSSLPPSPHPSSP